MAEQNYLKIIWREYIKDNCSHSDNVNDNSSSTTTGSLLQHPLRNIHEVVKVSWLSEHNFCSKLKHQIEEYH